MGYDYFGIVEAVDPRVKKSFKKGDRVPGLLYGSNAAPLNGGGAHLLSMDLARVTYN